MNSAVKLVAFVFAAFFASVAFAQEKRPDARFAIGALLHSDDFDGAQDKELANWKTERERGGDVTVAKGSMDISVPAGCTVWYKEKLSGPLMIQYKATVISAGGANDRVSDLNCFWMAHDSRSPDDLFATVRSGKFADYDRLLCYYVGQGGNTNTTTRFRRYIGQQDNRPLLPQNDLKDKPNLLTPNVSQTIRLVACGKLIQYWRDDKKVFEMIDDQAYTNGWFGIRTTKNHMRVSSLRIWQLKLVVETEPIGKE